MRSTDLLMYFVGAICGFNFAWPYTRRRTVARRHYAAALGIVAAIVVVLNGVLVFLDGVVGSRTVALGAAALLGAWFGLALGRYVTPPDRHEGFATPGSMWWVVPLGLALGIAAAAMLVVPDEYAPRYLLAFAAVLTIGRLMMVRRHRRVVDHKRREPVLRIDA